MREPLIDKFPYVEKILNAKLMLTIIDDSVEYFHFFVNQHFTVSNTFVLPHVESKHVRNTLRDIF